jgi:peptidoglycan/xylan/chitin deacetylase (PgdA/CDA1 family)
VPASLRGKDVEVIPTSRRVVALTFDGGANADGLASILATLDSASVRATFFLTGDFASRYPASVKAIVARGHRLGNHTATHPHLPALPSDEAVLNQLRVAETQIRAAGGTDPRPLFRFPFGDRTSHTIAVVNGAGYVAVRWTVDSLGWKGTVKGGITAQVVVDRVVSAARPGEIVLMHVGSNPDDHTTLDAQALPTVIARLRDLGYGFVTLDALLTAA